MFSFDIEILEMIQSLGEGFYILMKTLTKIGESNNYFFAIVLLMWCVNYRKFSTMVLLVPLSGLVTAVLKYCFQMPRPVQVSDKAELIEGYGMPSGHSMSAVVFWGYLCYVIKKKWFVIISVFLIIGISISRVYRSSHYPSQIVIGLLIGIILLWLCIHFEDRIFSLAHKLSVQKAWIISSILPLFFIGLTAVLMITKYDGSGMDDIKGVFSNAGLLFGFSIGLYLMNRKDCLNAKVSIQKQLVKIVIILISFFLVAYVNKYAEKAYDLSLLIGSLSVLTVNYFTALWFCYYGPRLLVKLNLNGDRHFSSCSS